MKNNHTFVMRKLIIHVAQQGVGKRETTCFDA